VSLAHRPPAVEPILRAAEALFRQHQDTRVALHSAEAKLEERAIVDQAKACLIRERRLSEPDAYRWPLGVSVLVCAHS
jgi:response regulator NasT